MIVLTNTRTLLKSDWIDAADAVRYAVYTVLYAVWAAAVVHSYRQYRKDRVLESAETVAVEERPTRPNAAAVNAVANAPVVAAHRPGPRRRPRRLTVSGAAPAPDASASGTGSGGHPGTRYRKRRYRLPSSRVSSSGGRPGAGQPQRGLKRPRSSVRCHAQVSATDCPSGRLGSPSARARVVSTSHPVGRPPRRAARTAGAPRPPPRRPPGPPPAPVPIPRRRR